MNFNSMQQEFFNLAGKLPELILALIVLLLGYIIAKAVEGAVRKGLRKTSWDEKLFQQSDEKRNSKYSSENIIAKVAFWLVMIFAFVWFFNILSLSFIAQPLVSMLSSITGAIPNIIKAALILIFAYVIALILKKLIQSGGRKAKADKFLIKTKAVEDEESGQKAIDAAAQIVFYLVLLIFLPAVLGALQLEGISAPFAGMLNSILSFIPKLFAAALIFLIGYVVARLVRSILSSFLKSIGTEKLAERFNMNQVFKGTTVSDVIGMIAFILIMIPVTISALETLNIRGISEPAISMLNDILTMLPEIATAILFILVGIALGKILKGIVSSILDRLGFNSLLHKMGLGAIDEGENKTSLSEIVGYIVQILVVFLFVVEAMQILNLAFMVELATGVAAYLPSVLAAILIIGFGLWLANLTANLLGNILQSSTGAPHILSLIAKYAIIVFAVFMALDQLGIAESIINTAFMLILGGLALAFGLAFGLGGRDKASKYLEKMDNRLNEVNVNRTDNNDQNNL
ncbi:mechanosensitive ion channel [Halobacillus yeomjeoni]|uniref:mechanosensitive ion channel n=1 Tax=Halobacillus yeomjeoni TaxID=311194 RepID=UPI001CD490FF|nr:mechanosensitive ion channel [Halobacillus yeomjeoni]MCA0983372.1 mechanosensitive ion channel [Halobacillus yeomjeoni]